MVPQLEAKRIGMAKLTERIRKANRTLLEMHIGMLAFGIVCQFAGVFFVKEQGYYAAALWLGVAFAAGASIHMCRTLDRALYCGSDASGIVTRGYLFRYGMAAAALVVISMTKIMNPLVFFVGYMSLKVTAYIQPITHKLCNRIFGERDPEPEPLPEETDAQKGEIPAE